MMMAEQGGASPGNVARFMTTDGAVLTGELADGTARADGSSYSLAEVHFLPPTVPTKVLCVGLNYLDHIEEIGDDIGMKRPTEPVLFLKPPSSVVGHQEPIVRPLGVSRLDYEGELAVVIGRRASNVTASEALDYVAGLTIANDVTAREYQVPGSQWTRAKGYDTFAPLGPCMVRTADWSGRRIETRVNSRVVQSSSTDRLIFDVPTLISYASSIMTLEPGDVILTGTPRGVGPLEDGDVVEIEVEGIGMLRNHVAGGLRPAPHGSSARNTSIQVHGAAEGPAPNRQRPAPVHYWNPPGLSAPIGMYSQVARARAGLVFVAGQLSVDAEGGSVGAGDFPAQMRQVFTNLGAALKAEGLDYDNIAQMTTYLRGEELIGDFYGVREVLFPDFFPAGVYPPNTLLVISRLVRPEFLIEVQCIAAS
jgi:2-keto-4-pentenoate hydratase/2-oxohepta-3-ene-1,7-dioic acid hydratase in catechol pathway/enamine deaminase RidA (YjgF/YER057c/UK114 family)